jgi:hypothetical protein
MACSLLPKMYRLPLIPLLVREFMEEVLMQSKFLTALAVTALVSATGAWAQVGPPPPPDTTAVWQLHIDASTTVQDAGINNGLTIGTDPAATDGFDADLDKQEPASGATNFVGVSIRHTNVEAGFENRAGSYIQDLRAPLNFGESKTFNNVTVASDLGTADAKASITLTWGTLTSVDPRIKLTFNDPNDVNADGITSYDMFTTPSFTFDQATTLDNPIVFNQFSITATNSTQGQAPVISNLQVTNITSTGFTVSYTTDVAAGGILDYGTSADALTSEMTATTPGTSQTFNVTGLLPNTPYFLRVRTAQAGLAEAASTVQNPTTLKQLTPVGTITFQPADTSAQVSFQSSDPTTATIEFGTSADKLDQKVDVTEAKASQTVVLPTLTPGTQYFVRVTRNAAGFDPLVSDILTFTTLGSFTLNDPVVSSITSTGATVTVNTGQPTQVTLNYGTTDLSQTQSTATPGTSNVFTLTGLTPGTTYQLQAKATSTGFEDKTSAVVTFTTLKTLTVAQQPTVSNITSGGATIDLATDVPVTAVLEYGTNNTFSQTSSISVPTATPSFALTGLTPNTPYQFRVRLQAAGYENMTLAPLTFTTGAAVNLGTGDINGDNAVNVADAILAARFVVGLTQLTPAQISAADVRLPQGTVDVGDVVWILKTAVGLIPPPPPGG